MNQATRTINRFRVQPEVKEIIRQCFVQFRCQWIEEKLIDQEAIFIDGTKIEANANKFTFVWKKSIEKYHQSLTVRDDQTGFQRKFKVCECEDCSECPFRSLCTKAKEGNNRKLMVNEKWEQQKEYVRAKRSEEKTSAIYRKRKIDVEPVFGFLKANLRFTRFSVRGKSKLENEMGLA
jgi:hypothetical protein